MRNLALLILILLLGSCTKHPEQGPAMEVDLMAVASEPQQKAEAPTPSALDKANETIPRKLVKNGEIEFETTDLAQTRETITNLVKVNGGYVLSDSEEEMSERKVNALNVKIPAEKFDAFLAATTKGITHFDRKIIRVQDVTAEYLDHEIRIKTKKEIEARYLQLLTRASTVKDVLEIEKELGNVRTEIESAEGQIKLLNDQIQYSALSIQFYKMTTSPSLFSNKLANAFQNGWENILDFMIELLNFWPFVLILLAIIFGIRRYKGKRKPSETT